MNREPEAELRRIVRMLEKTAQMAEHASLTGTLAGGQAYAVRSYNSILKHLTDTGEVPAALFPPLPEEASIDEVGIASTQLAGYLQAGLSESVAGAAGKDAGMKLGDGNVFFNIGSLDEIAATIRENLPEWLRGKRADKEPETGRTERPETAESGAPPPPSSATTPGNGEPPAAAWRSLPSQHVRIEELRPERRTEEAAG
jgi:hypothetical protein